MIFRPYVAWWQTELALQSTVVCRVNEKVGHCTSNQHGQAELGCVYMEFCHPKSCRSQKHVPEGSSHWSAVQCSGIAGLTSLSALYTLPQPTPLDSVNVLPSINLCKRIQGVLTSHFLPIDASIRVTWLSEPEVWHYSVTSYTLQANLNRVAIVQ